MPEPQPIRFPGDRTGILFLHGFSGSPAQFHELPQHCAQEGWTVQVVWLAGHGTTEQDLATKTYSDWVLSLRRALIELQPAVDRIVIIGDSFGGNLALHASLLGPPVSGVVCLGTPVSLRRDLLNRIAVPILARLRPFHRKSWVKDPAAHVASGSYLRVPLRAYQEVTRFIDRHTKREIDGVTVPLLIIQSKHDYEVHPDSAYFLYEHAASRQKELLWIDERVHHVLSSQEAPKLEQRIIDFIRGLPGVA